LQQNIFAVSERGGWSYVPFAFEKMFYTLVSIRSDLPPGMNLQPTQGATAIFWRNCWNSKSQKNEKYESIFENFEISKKKCHCYITYRRAGCHCYILFIEEFSVKRQILPFLIRKKVFSEKTNFGQNSAKICLL